MLRVHVLPQTCRASVGGIAKFANVRSFSRVNPLMNFQCLLRRESLSARVAHLLGVFVHSGNVDLQLCARSAALVANSTPEGIQRLVGPSDVLGQGAGPVEHLPAFLARGIVGAQLVDVLQMIFQSRIDNQFPTKFTRHLGPDSFPEGAVRSRTMSIGMLS